jgi:hypothetical protein
MPAPVADTGEFDLDRAISAANEATLAVSAAASLDIELPMEPVTADLGDLELATLLDSDLDGDQDDELGLDTTFDTDSLDLEALLNAPPPDPASDDLLDSLDDISDLS